MTESNSKVIAPAMQSKKPRTKWTAELFISKAKEVHGDIYDYSQAEYVDSKTHVCIICPEHSEFYQQPAVHLKGHKCPYCAGKKLSQDLFIQKARAVHGSKYLYENIVYLSSSQKVSITCKTHGSFEQRPTAHLRGNGCPKCGGTKKLTRRDFISQANKKHSYKYTYENMEYLSLNGDIAVTCSDHGDFVVRARSHLQNGKGCPKCEGKNKKYGRWVKSNTKIINDFIEVHGFEYDYSEVDYKNASSKVRIKCYLHGVFEQKANAHRLGHGCPDCGKEAFSWSRTKYSSYCEKVAQGRSNLYLIRCFNDCENFFKIGITLKENIRFRFPKGKLMPYDFKEVYFIRGNVGFVWDLEKRLHAMLKEYRYQPKISFGGETECFSHIPKEVIKFLDSLEKSSQLPLIA